MLFVELIVKGLVYGCMYAMMALGFLVAVMVSAVVGVAIYRLAYQPILHHAAFVPMVVSIGLFIVMQEGFRLIFGAYGIAFDTNPWYVANVNLAGITLT